ncbi:hypothetical protein BCR42DRAFT_420187 [Absidia repens]|uniref:Sphingomyelin phosphodiesterase 4 n=1 Tax=Absidia repens TaxID=90262 RepID=A0A1X2I9B1_9FUNG|nr:hypothetical protein BCR42DRAFT_420187 [Absidia repens]
MDNNKAFRDKDIIGICWHLNNYCESYININTVSTEHASAFHSFLPTLLTYIFGSPTTRGWLQTDTRREQDDAIRQLLEPRGHFLTALIKLGTRSEYCYDMNTEKFPDDIRKALAAGAIQYLPRVYEDCAFLDVSKATTLADLRASATRQSSIFPRPSVGEFRIRFNMIQFYMYYLTCVPTWPPLAPTSTPTPTPATTTTNTTTPYTSSSSLPSAGTSSYYSKIPYSTANSPYSKKPPPPLNTTTTTTTNSNLPHLIPGQLRSINASIYNEMMLLYMRAYIPCVINDTAPYVNGVGTFFLDALIELWIRTIWISPSQKLSLDFIQCLATFLKYVVGGDLRRCTSCHQNSNVNINNVKVESAYTNLYLSIKDELYLLLSRLSSNWRRQDDYIWVLNLWTLWAAPWRLGKNIITLNTEGQQQRSDRILQKESSPSPTTSSPQLTGVLEVSSPLETGWAFFILENAWYYITLVDSFLQRISTFTYPDKTIAQPHAAPTTVNGTNQIPSSSSVRPMYSTVRTTLPGTTASTTPARSTQPLDGSSLYGELNIFQILVDVWKSKYMVDYLGQIEEGLEIAARKLTLSGIPPSSTTNKPASSVYQPATFLQITRSKFSSALSSMTADQHQQKDGDTLGNLSSICYAGDRSKTDMVMQQLELLRDRILSVSAANDQQWKPSNIYSSAQRQPRSDHLVKSVQGIYHAMDTRIHPTEKSQTWKNSVLGGQKKVAAPTASKDIAVLSAMLTDLSSLLKLPFPDGSRTMFPQPLTTNKDSTGTTGGSSSSSSTLTNRHIGNSVSTTTTSSASSSSLTSNVQKNDLPSGVTSRRERPKMAALGPRAETSVRSFESKFMLRRILPIERRVNSIYHWSRMPTIVYTPDYLSLRWMAAPINLVYLFIILLLIYFIV